jgi:hypothetical protein
LGVSVIVAFSIDPATGKALVGITDVASLNTPGIVLSIDLSSGAITTLQGVPGFATGMAVNPSAGTAGVALEASGTGLGITDLASGNGALVSPGGRVYEFPTAIPGTGDFMVAEVGSPNGIGSMPNNNAESSVIVTDAAGNVPHRDEQFNFFNTFLANLGGYVQVNPGTSRAFTLGPGGAQLHPFTFTR